MSAVLACLRSVRDYSLIIIMAFLKEAFILCRLPSEEELVGVCDGNKEDQVIVSCKSKGISIIKVIIFEYLSQISSVGIARGDFCFVCEFVTNYTSLAKSDTYQFNFINF